MQDTDTRDRSRWLTRPVPIALVLDAVGIAKHPHLGPVLPAMGYSDSQVEALRTTLNAADADFVIAGTPIDLSRAMKLDKPVRRARYEFAELERPGVWDLVERFLKVKEKQV